MNKHITFLILMLNICLFGADSATRDLYLNSLGKLVDLQNDAANALTFCIALKRKKLEYIHNHHSYGTLPDTEYRRISSTIQHSIQGLHKVQQSIANEQEISLDHLLTQTKKPSPIITLSQISFILQSIAKLTQMCICLQEYIDLSIPKLNSYADSIEQETQAQEVNIRKKQRTH